MTLSSQVCTEHNCSFNWYLGFKRKTDESQKSNVYFFEAAKLTINRLLNTFPLFSAAKDSSLFSHHWFFSGLSRAVSYFWDTIPFWPEMAKKKRKRKDFSIFFHQQLAAFLLPKEVVQRKRWKRIDPVERSNFSTFLSSTRTKKQEVRGNELLMKKSLCSRRL